MKNFGSSTNAPFVAPSGNILENDAQELQRPTNQQANAFYGELRESILASGQTLTTLVADDQAQLAKSQTINALKSALFIDGGTANTKQLSISAPTIKLPTISLLNGAMIRFQNAVTNTTAVTLNIAGVSQVTPLDVYLNGAPVVAGELLAGVEYSGYINFTSNRFDLLFDHSYLVFSVLNSTNISVSAVSSGLSVTTSSVSSVSSGLINTNSSVSAISSGLSATTSSVSSVSSGLSNTNTSVSSVSSGLSTTVSSVSAISSGFSTLSSGVGYYAGQGGTVTQLTSKSTGVTLNKQSGKIIMDASSLAGTTSVAFTFTNSFIGANDIPHVFVSGGATTLTYAAYVENRVAGTCSVVLRNTSVAAQAEAVELTFNIFKGAIT